MSFANNTPWAALDVPIMDHTGRDVVVAIVKATFHVDSTGRAVPAEEPSSIRTADVLWDPDREHSSTRYPSDVVTEKVGTDVIVVGEAISPRPVTVLDVVVQVGQRKVPLRVHGPRLFCRGVLGIEIGPAVPFDRVPITYERAFGGTTADGSLVEPRNWSGVGVAAKPADLVDRPAPQIEHPARPVTGPNSKHAPVGYGAIQTHWSPRRELSGTFDAAWLSTRMPIMPHDFDLRHNNCAHPSLRIEEGLAPGEPISMMGLSEEGGVFAFELPRLAVEMRARFDGAPPRAVAARIDTVVVEPAARRVEVVARAAFPVGRAKEILRAISVETVA